MSDELLLKPIGILRSCYPDKFGTPRQPGLVPQATAELEIRPEFQGEFALEGLQEFSHVWLIFGFHRNTNGSKYRPKVHPPRLEGKSIGVFATRSPHRPNPLGLSLVKLEKVEGRRLWLSGIDMIDGTPIYDVKPYLPEVESRPGATAGWSDRATDPEIEFEWPEKPSQDLQRWQRESGRSDLRNLVEATLKRDPRPLVYRGFEGEDVGKYRQSHAVRLFEGDIHFSFTSPNRIRIDKILADLPILPGSI